MSAAPIALDHDALAAVEGRIERYLAGTEELTGLELYYDLERATSLRELHTMLRMGPKNRTRSGLQQSYGDHNRLLLLGIDRLLDRDLEWLRTRLESAGIVDDDRLRACLDVVAALDLGRAPRVALWLGCAMHDCGMLGGHIGTFDVEDGAVIARELLDVLCPPDLIDLAVFAVRNHDYIKDVFLGEVPPSFVADQLDKLDEPLRAPALVLLGMIQVAGSASLGEGRLTSFRIEVFERCADSSALDDGAASTRFARLLDDGDESTVDPARGHLARWAALGDDDRAALSSMLERRPIHGWHKAWRQRNDPPAPDAKVAALLAIAREHDADRVDHLALTADAGVLTAGWTPVGEHLTLANGTTALVLT